MAHKVRWTESAAEDLRIAAEYIERDSPAYASVLVQKVLDAADSLRFMAERGRRLPEWEDAAVREVFVMNHRVIYHVSKSAVHILAIIHCARDLRRSRTRSGS